MAKRIFRWEPLPLSAEECYEKAKDANVKLSRLKLCNTAFTMTALDLAVLQRDVDYLDNRLRDLLIISNDRLAIRRHTVLTGRVELLDEKKRAFIRAVDIIDEKFMPIYRERLKAGK